MTAGVKAAASLIKESHYAIALTGAGISTSSGIPDFRSATGLWQRYDLLKSASISAFRKNPENFYQWFHPLARAIYAARPNPAHTALAQLQKAGYLHEIITQNIDPLHQQAGAEQVLQVHGELNRMTCLACGAMFKIQQFIEPFLQDKTTPACPHCSQILKPDVVLYGELLPPDVWQEAVQAVEKCDLMLIAGSSLEVAPVSGLPTRALKNGVKLIIINNDPTNVDSQAAEVIHQDVVKALPEIINYVL